MYGIVERATLALSLCYDNECSVVRSSCFVYGMAEENRSEMCVVSLAMERQERTYNRLPNKFCRSIRN